jgi:hypothetical protein
MSEVSFGHNLDRLTVGVDLGDQWSHDCCWVPGIGRLL